MSQVDEQSAVAGTGLGEEAGGLTGDFGQTVARCFNDQSRSRNQIGNGFGDRRKAT